MTFKVWILYVHSLRLAGFVHPIHIHVYVSCNKILCIFSTIMCWTLSIFMIQRLRYWVLCILERSQLVAGLRTLRFAKGDG